MEEKTEELGMIVIDVSSIHVELEKIIILVITSRTQEKNTRINRMQKKHIDGIEVILLRKREIKGKFESNNKVRSKDEKRGKLLEDFKER